MAASVLRAAPPCRFYAAGKVGLCLQKPMSVGGTPRSLKSSSLASLESGGALELDHPKTFLPPARQTALRGIFR